jgi:hypothetical protein
VFFFRLRHYNKGGQLARVTLQNIGGCLNAPTHRAYENLPKAEQINKGLLLFGLLYA